MDEVIWIKQATNEGVIACKNGGVFDCSYPTSKLRRGWVQGGGDISPTLTCESGGIVRIEIVNENKKPKVLAHWPGRNMCSGNVYDKNEICQSLMAAMGTGGTNQPLIHLEDKKMEKTELGMEVENEKGISFEILCLLRKTIGEKEFSEWSFRGICYFLQTEVLQHRMYAKRILEDWQEQSELEQFSYYSQKGEWLNITEESMRKMWEDWQTRCSPYRSQFSEQQLRQLDDFMQKLPHEDSSSETCLQDLWDACEGIRVLQQALSEIQKIRKSFGKYRIRKLTPLETWRLMNFTDADFEKAQAVNSNSQLYKQAGNSIVVACLIAIFSQLGIQGHKRWNEMTLEERRELIYKGTVLEAQ